jgi:N-acetylglutamate synthase-like GNAT family acetyltransferase
MILKATGSDLPEICAVINDAAFAYKGIIPADRWHEPYMSMKELQEQVAEGVTFLYYAEDNKILGVMGIQDKNEVALIRHAYVLTDARRKGIGAILLQALVKSTNQPILIGTWKAAHWAISFYEKHGFRIVPGQEKNNLLKRYWTIPDRQVETSVVLADEKYINMDPA